MKTYYITFLMSHIVF